MVAHPEDMRQRGEWMVPSDDAILELIREHGNLTPSAIDDLGGPSAQHAGIRCRKLRDAGLLHQISHGLYGITDKGLAFLNEELDASTVSPDE